MTCVRRRSDEVAPPLHGSGPSLPTRLDALAAAARHVGELARRRGAEHARVDSARIEYHPLMDLAAKFEDAQVRVKQLSKSPSTDDLLELYALYKQSTAGDVSGARPGMLDMKGRAKFDAWATKKGTSKDDAMTKYVALVDRLGA